MSAEYTVVVSVPECTPACSMCCKMPQMVTLPSWSHKASTSNSSARSMYLSTRTGLSGSTSTAFSMYRFKSVSLQHTNKHIRSVICKQGYEGVSCDPPVTVEQTTHPSGVLRPCQTLTVCISHCEWFAAELAAEVHARHGGSIVLAGEHVIARCTMIARAD